MITQRFRPVVWVVGVAVAATTLYMISLQVASERGRLQELDQQIASTRREIRQLQTELGTRANLRQLERWNGEVLALSAPGAEQYLHDEASLASFDQGVLAGKTDVPAVMFADAAATMRDEQVVAPELAAAPVAPEPVAVPKVRAATARPAPKPKADDADKPVKLSERDKDVQKALGAKTTDKRDRPAKVASVDKALLKRSTLGDLSRAASREAGKGGRDRP
jgi:hypothetical protein